MSLFVVSGIAYREQIRMDVRLLFLHNYGRLIVMQQRLNSEQ